MNYYDAVLKNYFGYLKKPINVFGFTSAINAEKKLLFSSLFKSHTQEVTISKVVFMKKSTWKTNSK